MKYKRVNGKTYVRVNGAPALWFNPSAKWFRGKPRTYSRMELEAKRRKR